jgi:hypothetical protein
MTISIKYPSGNSLNLYETEKELSLRRIVWIPREYREDVGKRHRHYIVQSDHGGAR